MHVAPEDMVDFSDNTISTVNSEEALGHIMAVLQEHQDQFLANFLQSADRERFGADVALDFVRKDDEENEDNGVVENRNEDPTAVISSHDEGDYIDNDCDGRGKDSNDQANNAGINVRTSISADTDTSLAPVKTPAPIFTPNRTPMVVSLRTPSGHPPSERYMPDTVSGDGPHGFYSPGSESWIGADGGGDEVFSDGFKQAWESLM